MLVPLAVRAGALGAARGRWGWLTVITLVQVVAPFLLIVYGENHVPSALAGILVSSAPIFTALLATRFDRAERLRGWSLRGHRAGHRRRRRCSSAPTCRAAATRSPAGS